MFSWQHLHCSFISLPNKEVFLTSWQLHSVCVCMCVGVCLCVQPDVSVCISNHVISRQGPWLLPLLAHNSSLIQHRNIQTHKYTGRHTLSYFVHPPAGFFSFLTSHSAVLTLRSSMRLLLYTTAPSSGKMLSMNNKLSKTFKFPVTKYLFHYTKYLTALGYKFPGHINVQKQ